MSSKQIKLNVFVVAHYCIIEIRFLYEFLYLYVVRTCGELDKCFILIICSMDICGFYSWYNFDYSHLQMLPKKTKETVSIFHNVLHLRE